MLSSTVFAQFGQNRVTYKNYDWFFIQTKHFDIYFAQESSKIAEFTAHTAEKAVEEIQEDLDYQINNRISIILYNSHNDFQETNTTDGYLSQGIGGFTEPFKNRVVFPFEGDYEKFAHVTKHELVHAVMRDLLYGGTVQNIIQKGITLQLPTWYHEGMAEYLSSEWDTKSDMFIRDAIINEYLPDINQLNGYFAYRGGQALFKYIAEKYGREKIGEMLFRIKGVGGVESGIKSSLGLTIEELNERWKKDLKKTYWPAIAEKQDPDEFARRMTNNKKTGGFYNTSPAISPQGDKIAFISDRDIYLDVYVMNAFDGEIIDKVVSSGKTSDFEELNVLYPTLTWAPDNERIAMSSKSGGFDVIYIVNVETGESYDLPLKFGGIESVAWSPDGDKIAFVGHNHQQNDIYLYNFETDEVTNLTNDIFTDSDPVWTPDSKTVIYASDRGDYLRANVDDESFSIIKHNYRQTDLYQIRLESEETLRLTDWPNSSERFPVISEDGKEMLFISDISGINNIYKKRIIYSEEDEVASLAKIESVPITNSLNEINQLSLSYDGKKLVFSSLFKGGYNIYLVDNPFDPENEKSKLALTEFRMAQIEPKKEEKSDDEEISMQVSNAASVLNKQTIKPDTTLSVNEKKIFTGQFVQDEDQKSDTSDTPVDYSNYIFGKDEFVNDSTFQMVDKEDLFIEKLDDDGNYLVNKYKVSFSPDLVYANAGYSTFYGLLGTTTLSFSDMLGNHRLIGVTSLQIDLKNSDYGLAYYYLGERWNLGIEAFHTARFVYIGGIFSTDLYRYRNFGGVVSLSYPISRFKRIEGSLSYLNISSENLDNFTIPMEEISYVIPSLSIVHDNTLFGYYSPIEGSRYKVTAFGSPGLTGKSKSFYSVVGDFRKYFRFWYDNGFLIRFSGGLSGGANAQRFILGGTENWINRSFATGELPFNNASDFAFLTPALPLRGYDYAEQIGTKYSLLNVELRMPIIRYLLTGGLPLLFQNILGTVFFDIGAAWDNTESLKFFGKNEFGETVSEDVLMSTGIGFRTYFIFLWKFDIAWKYDVKSFSQPRYLFSIGLDL